MRAENKNHKNHLLKDPDSGPISSKFRMKEKDVLPFHSQHPISQRAFSMSPFFAVHIHLTHSAGQTVLVWLTVLHQAHHFTLPFTYSKGCLPWLISSNHHRWWYGPTMHTSSYCLCMSNIFISLNYRFTFLCLQKLKDHHLYMWFEFESSGYLHYDFSNILVYAGNTSKTETLFKIKSLFVLYKYQKHCALSFFYSPALIV